MECKHNQIETLFEDDPDLIAVKRCKICKAYWFKGTNNNYNRNQQ